MTRMTLNIIQDTKFLVSCHKSTMWYLKEIMSLE